MADFGRANSIPVDKLDQAVLQATKSHAGLLRGDEKAGWWLNPGILGIWLENVPIGGVQFDEVTKTANEIKSAAGLTGQAGSVVFDNHIIVGVFPVDNFTTISR